jgi:hypothetical protein
MASSWMLRRVALVRTDVSEDRSASIIRITRIRELGATLAVTSNRPSLRRATRRSIPKDAILHIYRRENLKSYNNNNCRTAKFESYLEQEEC